MRRSRTQQIHMATVVGLMLGGLVGLPSQASAQSVFQEAYVKASNSDARDGFSWVAISGTTLAVGALSEDSKATGVDSFSLEGNNGYQDAGAVYVYDRVGASWQFSSYIKASNTDSQGGFGDSFGVVDIDGDTLVVGAAGEDGNGSSQLDNSAAMSGAAYVFERVAGTWSQAAYLKAPTPISFDAFGRTVAVSGDTVLVGSHDTSLSGAVDVFVRNGGAWSHQARLKAPAPQQYASFGQSLDIDGDTAVIGAPGGSGPGETYVYRRGGTAWSHVATLTASNAEAGDGFGVRAAISGDTIAVAAWGEDSDSSGLDGDQANASPPHLSGYGAVYLFREFAGSWSQEAYVKASNPDEDDSFGRSLGLSGDLMVVGCASEASASMGVGGDELDNSADSSGAAYLFRRHGTAWSQIAYLKASNTETGDRFGQLVAIDGDTVAVGAPGEDSPSIGVNGPQAEGADDSGAVYILHVPDVRWGTLGGGTSASAGPVMLEGSGALTAGAPTLMTVSGTPAGAAILGWIALTPSNFLAVGGTVHAYPYIVQIAAFADAGGEFSGVATMPPGVPADTNIWFQFVVQDTSSPHGLLLTNGVLATTP